MYLAVVIDLASRRIVGWELSDRLKKQLVIDALRNAFQTRQPEKGLVFHSDRGSQYASREFRRQLRRYGMVSSRCPARATAGTMPLRNGFSDHSNRSRQTTGSMKRGMI
jgi:transposase InsO family protein